MQITTSSLFSQVGVNFSISHKVSLYIRKKLNEIIVEEYALNGIRRVIGRTGRMKKMKSLLILTAIITASIFVTSLVISQFKESSLSNALFLCGIIVLLVGIFSSMRGRAFGNKLVPHENEYAVLDPVEAEREHQEIRNQGTIKYVTENRMLNFRDRPFAMIISGVIGLVAAYFVA